MSKLIKEKQSARQTGQEKLSKEEQGTEEGIKEWARDVIKRGYKREDVLNLLYDEKRGEREGAYILNVYDNELDEIKKRNIKEEIVEKIPVKKKEIGENTTMPKEAIEDISKENVVIKTTPKKTGGDITRGKEENEIIIEEESVKDLLKKTKKEEIRKKLQKKMEEEKEKERLKKKMEEEKEKERERLKKVAEEKEKEKERLKKTAEEKKEEGEVKAKQEKLKKILISHNNQIKLLKKEIGKSVVGQEKIINGIIRGFLADGHVLIEGVPGIAKTLLIKTLAIASGCQFSRIQFTVDLLPTDITGVTTYDESKKEFSTFKGPIFANFIIADEINRAPPKSQSAMLEAMQEKQVTIGKNTHKLPSPFFVMANNNPLESSGTYPLPEAQVDRFLFKLKMEYTSNEDEEKIIDTNMTTKKFENFKIKPIISPKKILEMQESVKEITASPEIKKYIIRIIDATRNPKKHNIKLGKYIEWGCSPRASIGLNIAAKTDALLHGIPYITPQNIKNVVYDVLRHRLILNYSGQAEKIKSEDVISEILKKVPLP